MLDEPALPPTLLDTVSLARSALAAAVSSTTTGVLITDPNLPGNPIVFVNPAFTRITGYDAEEAIGRSCRMLQGRDTDRATVERLRRAIQLRRAATVTLRSELRLAGEDAEYEAGPLTVRADLKAADVDVYRYLSRNGHHVRTEKDHVSYDPLDTVHCYARPQKNDGSKSGSGASG